LRNSRVMRSSSRSESGPISTPSLYLTVTLVNPRYSRAPNAIKYSVAHAVNCETADSIDIDSANRMPLRRAFAFGQRAPHGARESNAGTLDPRRSNEAQPLQSPRARLVRDLAEASQRASRRSTAYRGLIRRRVNVASFAAPRVGRSRPRIAASGSTKFQSFVARTGACGRQQSGGPNDLAFDDDGNLFVTDPVLARIWKIDPLGNPTVFVEHPLLAGTPDAPVLVFRAVGVNGIAFDKRQKFLYVSNTDQGRILRLDARSPHPVPTTFASDARLRGADGIAFDRDEALWVAVNAADSLLTVNERAEVRLQVRGGLLDAPSSVVFGASQRDRDQLYLMSSAFSRTLGFQPGTAHPALLTVRVATPGLPLF